MTIRKGEDWGRTVPRPEGLRSVADDRELALALADGTGGEGRGFVLMPSAAPYGRTITPRTMTNYETMVRLTESFGG